MSRSMPSVVSTGAMAMHAASMSVQWWYFQNAGPNEGRMVAPRTTDWAEWARLQRSKKAIVVTVTA
jgi:hypothetical protein